MKYIIFYAALEGDDFAPSDYVSSYDVAFSKEDIPSIIEYARNAYLAYNFSVFELGEEVTKEFINNKE